MQCQQKTKSAKDCPAFAMKGSQFCFMHNPKTKQQRKEAAKRGGSFTYKQGLIPLEPIDFTKPKPILYLLADTINRIRKADAKGVLDLKTANAIGFLAGKMLEAQKVVTFEERLDLLESKLMAKGIIK